jgi:peptide deformylase
MAKLRILFCGDPVLRKRAQTVKTVDGDVRKLVEDMTQTMIEAPGVGLAAPQVGAPVRMVVVRIEDDGPIYQLINPRIVDCHGEDEGLEGCLSLPTLQGIVKRPAEVTVEATTLDEGEVCIKADGFLARALQHEIDHLDGVLFIDRVDEDTLGWLVPDDSEEGGYRVDPTTIKEVVQTFERLNKARQKQEGAA